MSSADNFYKQFRPRSGPTKCRAWSGSKLFESKLFDTHWWLVLKDLFFRKRWFWKKSANDKTWKITQHADCKVNLRLIVGDWKRPILFMGICHMLSRLHAEIEKVLSEGVQLRHFFWLMWGERIKIPWLKWTIIEPQWIACVFALVSYTISGDFRGMVQKCLLPFPKQLQLLPGLWDHLS